MYIDAGSGSMLFQAAAAIIISGMVFWSLRISVWLLLDSFQFSDESLVI